MTVMTIIGARPQFIKAAVVSQALAKYGVKETIIHTGQHFDANMSDVFFEELGIPEPSCDLGIGGGSHGQNTGRMIEAIEKALLKQKPDWVLVYGDTDSTLAGSLAAVKLHIPVAHVEAGLRSFNRLMPEEINRILTDHAASLLFAPSHIAVQNLATEGIPQQRVKYVGDVMLDAAIHYSKKAQQKSKVLHQLDLEAKSYVLSTIHRAENTDDPNRLSNILHAFADFSGSVILPLHPRTRACLNKFGFVLPSNVRLIDPVGYLDMVMLEKNACLIATDSGGIQKEAFFHGVPCVTLRDETEWTELVDAGWNRLAPPVDGVDIAAIMKTALCEKGEPIELYGHGEAADYIAKEMAAEYG